MNLKPCPFCGGEAVLWNNALMEAYRLHSVRCKNCEIETPYCLSEEEARKVWNRREPIDKIVEQLEDKMITPLHIVDDFDIGWNRGINRAIEIVKRGAV